MPTSALPKAKAAKFGGNMHKKPPISFTVNDTKVPASRPNLK